MSSSVVATILLKYNIIYKILFKIIFLLKVCVQRSISYIPGAILETKNDYTELREYIQPIFIVA